MGRRALTVLASLALVTACAAPTGRSASPGSASGISQSSDGTWRIVGYSRETPDAALQDALRRAYALAEQRGQKMTPLKVTPRAADAPGGGAEYSCALSFRMEREPSAVEQGAAEHSFAAFEHRMRLLVEQHVLTIEEYARLVDAHPGNPLVKEPRPAAAPLR